MNTTQIVKEKLTIPFCNYFSKSPCIANWEIGNWNITNYHYEIPFECRTHGCRNTCVMGNDDGAWFEKIGFVCSVCQYLIPRKTPEELEDLGLDYGESFWFQRNNNFEIRMFPTVVYTSDGKRKEFIHPEGQKRKDELDEFFRSRRK